MRDVLQNKHLVRANPSAVDIDRALHIVSTINIRIADDWAVSDQCFIHYVPGADASNVNPPRQLPLSPLQRDAQPRGPAHLTEHLPPALAINKPPLLSGPLCYRTQAYISWRRHRMAL